MEESRDYLIERLPGQGKLDELKELLEPNYTQEEINIALVNALAYSQIEIAEYLISLGADMSHWDYDGVYYAVHNNEIEGLKFSIEHGVNVNINNGQLLNTSIITAYNEKDTSILKWLLENDADTSLIENKTLKAFGTVEINKLINNAKKEWVI